MMKVQTMAGQVLLPYYFDYHCTKTFDRIYRTSYHYYKLMEKIIIELTVEKYGIE